MKKPLSYEARLKNMKASVEIMKVELLYPKGFPDDVSYVGSPALVHMYEGRNHVPVGLPENKEGGKTGKNN